MVDWHYFIQFGKLNVFCDGNDLNAITRVSCTRRFGGVHITMSGDAHHSRRPRPPKMYMVASDYRVQDQLEGTIRLQRGQLCVEQEGGGHRGGRGYLWVKVRAMCVGGLIK